MASNLPPGVTTNMIPGNRPEDREWEIFCDWALDRLTKSSLDISECRRAVLMGIAAVNTEREELGAEIKWSGQSIQGRSRGRPRPIGIGNTKPIKTKGSRDGKQD